MVPVLLQLTRGADDLQRRVDMVRALTDLVVLMRQHVRRFLPDLLALVNDFWGSSVTMLPHILSLLAELSREWAGDGRGGRLGGKGGMGGLTGAGGESVLPVCLPSREPPAPVSIQLSLPSACLPPHLRPSCSSSLSP